MEDREQGEWVKLLAFLMYKGELQNRISVDNTRQ